MKASEFRQLRQQLGLSQARFAALLGVAPNTVARWERGELGMRGTTARLIELVAKQQRRTSPAKRTSHERTGRRMSEG
jgi:DNA-binding transcriptional regulator YiaG